MLWPDTFWKSGASAVPNFYSHQQIREQKLWVYPRPLPRNKGLHCHRFSNEALTPPYLKNLLIKTYIKLLIPKSKQYYPNKEISYYFRSNDTFCIIAHLANNLRKVELLENSLHISQINSS